MCVCGGWEGGINSILGTNVPTIIVIPVIFDKIKIFFGPYEDFFL